jgi:hypothetical protein
MTAEGLLLVRKSPPLVSAPGQMNTVEVLTPYLLKTHVNNTSPSNPSVFPSRLPTQFLMCQTERRM